MEAESEMRLRFRYQIPELRYSQLLHQAVAFRSLYKQQNSVALKQVQSEIRSRTVSTNIWMTVGRFQLSICWKPSIKARIHQMKSTSWNQLYRYQKLYVPNRKRTSYLLSNRNAKESESLSLNAEEPLKYVLLLSEYEKK